MQPNVGAIDRLFRLVLGIALVGAALTQTSVFANPVVQYIGFGLGIIAIITATLRICLIYTLFGLRTCDCDRT